jgi:Tfp pilus assembly protein PilF
LFDHAFKLSPMVKPRVPWWLFRCDWENAKQQLIITDSTRAFVTPQGDQVFSAASRAELGAALLENELTADAILELTAALNAEPSNAETVVRLGKAHLAANDIPMAGRSSGRRSCRGIDNAAIDALLASVYEKSGHMEHAIPAMRLAIQKDPQSEQYRFSYGMLLISALAPDAAVIRLKGSARLFPNSSHLWLALGIAHFKGGRNDEAAKSLSHSIELDAKYAPAFVYLGMTYVETGQYINSCSSYERSLAINGKLGIVNFLIADVMLKQTDADYAVVETNLVKAVKSDPKFARLDSVWVSYTCARRVCEKRLLSLKM